MSRLTRDGTAEPVSRDQILRHARGQGNVHFPCPTDHEQDWQPYPVDPYSAICDDHTYIHIHTSLYDPPLPRLLYFQVNTVVGLFCIMLKISTWLVVFFAPPQNVSLVPFMPLYTFCIIFIKTLYTAYYILRISYNCFYNNELQPF